MFCYFLNVKHWQFAAPMVNHSNTLRLKIRTERMLIRMLRIRFIYQSERKKLIRIRNTFITFK